MTNEEMKTYIKAWKDSITADELIAQAAALFADYMQFRYL